MTEVVFSLAETLGFKADRDLLLKVSLEAGMRIDFRQSDWLDRLIGVLAQAASKKKKLIRELMQAKPYLTDSLIHVQLGNPDRIFIHKK